MGYEPTTSVAGPTTVHDGWAIGAAGSAPMVEKPTAPTGWPSTDARLEAVTDTEPMRSVPST